jgi:hypothetical protein
MGFLGLHDGYSNTMSNTIKQASGMKTVALTDMLTFLKMQQGERYRAFLVHGPPRCGKTAFARKLASAASGVYLDVLATIAATPELAEQVDVLDARFLKRLALEAAPQGAGLVLVDDFDFLLPIWGDDLSPLIEIIRRVSPPETQATIGFFMQTTPTLEALGLHNSAGQKRILRLDEIQGL